MTDKFKGTGVFSAIEFERESTGAEPPATAPETPTAEQKQEAKETVPK